MMNRSKQDQLPQMQIQFLQSVCIPLYNVMYNKTRSILFN